MTSLAQLSGFACADISEDSVNNRCHTLSHRNNIQERCPSYLRSTQSGIKIRARRPHCDSDVTPPLPLFSPVRLNKRTGSRKIKAISWYGHLSNARSPLFLLNRHVADHKKAKIKKNKKKYQLRRFFCDLPGTSLASPSRNYMHVSGTGTPLERAKLSSTHDKFPSALFLV